MKIETHKETKNTKWTFVEDFVGKICIEMGVPKEYLESPAWGRMQKDLDEGKGLVVCAMNELIRQEEEKDMNGKQIEKRQDDDI